MSHIFGPVPSRRLGYSLGVDLVRPKTCTQDCLYCECGPTTLLTLKRDEYVPYDEVAREVKEFLSEPPEHLDYVTLSGAGEPSLNSRMGDVLELLRNISPARVAVLTNSTLMTEPEVRRELMLARVVVPSLDTAVEETFRRLNRPHPDLEIGDIIDGLRKFRESFRGEMRLEVLLAKGINDSPGELDALRRAIESIRPDLVEVNTVFRPAARPVERLTEEELAGAAACITASARAVGAFVGGGHSARINRLAERVMEVVSRRPCTLEELTGSLGAVEREVKKVLSSLEGDGRLTAYTWDGRTFYRAKKT